MRILGMKLKIVAIISGILLLASCAANNNDDGQVVSNKAQANEFGVLLMAHGGSPDWNAAVVNSLSALRNRYPVEIAFGMSDASSMEQAIRKLEAQGVKHAGVVRLFISGESWYERTLQILGVVDGAPAKSESNHLTLNPRMPMGFWQIETDMAFHVSKEGLAEAEEMDEVLLSRVRGLSTNPSAEVVAVIAHGPADDEENQRWVDKISERTDLLKQELGVNDIAVFTLREDWEEKRAGAEELIRGYLEHAIDSKLKPIVVPYRVQGFGPYADVLAGLEYTADQVGLVPHENVALWISNRTEELAREADQHRFQVAASED